jgi:hypothetical protein
MCILLYVSCGLKSRVGDRNSRSPSLPSDLCPKNHQSSQEEADSRVLPNLFVESFSSYSGLKVPPHSKVEFDKLATKTKHVASSLSIINSLILYHQAYSTLVYYL